MQKYQMLHSIKRTAGGKSSSCKKQSDSVKNRGILTLMLARFMISVGISKTSVWSQSVVLGIIKHITMLIL